MHEEQGYTGLVNISPTYRSKEHIKEALDKYKCVSMLDYGCASGVQYEKGLLHEYLNVEIGLYDPAVEKYNVLPDGVYDAVLCYDVLEHIHEEDLDYVLNRIFSKASKLVLIKVGLAPAVATLPNGENAHCTVKKLDWWAEKIKSCRNKDIPVLLNNKTWV